jgi:chromosome segregation protein
MRLKSLEIKGFKSFANETLVHFNDRVTGVVGPNGSGKSNIVDAIRWVLGDQSAKELRLDKMSSVIFNGSKKRKPSGMAQVTITFDNTRNLLPTEYSTVSVTRQLYRSGESEYRINGVVCRLKDIHSLFMDTGIGSDSYAIIALGMVDEILSDKDNSRRRMLEQAAGISKYKQRKKETLSKLKSTTEDLERVQDLLYEIEKNMKMLERQAKRAEKYLEIRAEYREKSLSLASVKTKEIHEKINKIEHQIEKEMDLFGAVEAQFIQWEAQLEQQKKQTLDKEKDLSEAQRNINQLVGQIRGMESDKKMKEQEDKFATETLARLESEALQLQRRAEQLEEEMEVYQEKSLEAAEEEELVKIDLQAQELALNVLRNEYKALQIDRDDVVKKQTEVERDRYELEKNIAVNNNQIINARSEIGRNQKDKQAKELEIDQWRSKARDLEAWLLVHREDLKTLEEEENNRQLALDQLGRAVEEAEQKLQQINRVLDAKKNEYKLTKSMLESMEGFPESIRFLSKNKDWAAEGVLLSDTLYVEDSAIRPLVETYLESYLNYFVVDHVSEAIAAIEKLSAAQKGKANFIILDQLPPSRVQEEIPPGTTRLADYLAMDAKYQALKDFLFSGVYILNDSSTQNEILGSNHQTLIARDGKFHKKGAILGGGSMGLFEGKKLGRKKNLEILSLEIENLEKSSQEVSQDLKEKLEKRSQLRKSHAAEKIQKIRRDLQGKEGEYVQWSTRLENARDLLAVLEGKEAEVENRILDLQEQNEEWQSKLALIQKEWEALRDTVAREEGVFNEKALQLTEMNQVYNSARIEYIKKQNLTESFRKELDYRRGQQREVQKLVENNQLQTQEKTLQLSLLTQQILGLQEALKKSYEQRKELEKTLNGVEQAYYSYRSEIQELENNLKQLSKRKSDLQSLVNGLKESRNELRFQLTALTERVSVEFNLESQAILAMDASHGDVLALEELEIQIKQLKMRLDQFGEVNPMAVEAYQEIKDRYDEILAQRSDILKAKGDLEQTIQEIEDSATLQFLSAFAQVRAHFIEVFRSLFTEGDDCDMKLSDPEAPLDSDIVITAKPKGKKPQSLSQLSGGEKTLTATALLFALYLLKPAPFCIFDEVDAPLDDANIEKFNKIIKKFSEQSQFIIITHNKLTMTEVDVIYGVYMEEMGISAVSPVDFRSFEHQDFISTLN